MKYYVVADVHGFYKEFIDAITAAGFFTETKPYKLVVCGDLFDRGEEAVKLQNFILELMAKDKVILVRGNHEDLYVDLLERDEGLPFYRHRVNGTYDTALQLTGYNKLTAGEDRLGFVKSAMDTPFYRTIIPACCNYFEEGKYLFVHGWIPMIEKQGKGKVKYSYNADWRNAPPQEWYKCRWYNGMDASREVIEPKKTIVCGHWHCSYGHSLIEGRGSEFGEDADFSPYVAKGIIALDACTVRSKKVNCVVLET